MNIKDYLIETTVSGDIATFDKKIGEEPIEKFTFTTKKDASKFIKKFKENFEVTIVYNPVTKEGIVTGNKSNVDLFMKQIKKY